MELVFTKIKSPEHIVQSLQSHLEAKNVMFVEQNKYFLSELLHIYVSSVFTACWEHSANEKLWTCGSEFWSSSAVLAVMMMHAMFKRNLGFVRQYKQFKVGVSVTHPEWCMGLIPLSVYWCVCWVCSHRDYPQSPFPGFVPPLKPSLSLPSSCECVTVVTVQRLWEIQIYALFF